MYDFHFRKNRMSTMTMDSFRCISVLGRGHFGKVRSYVEINFV